jgi:hypothetical protein
VLEGLNQKSYPVKDTLFSHFPCLFQRRTAEKEVPILSILILPMATEDNVILFPPDIMGSLVFLDALRIVLVAAMAIRTPTTARVVILDYTTIIVFILDVG